jgi:hypothetical protein
LLTPHALHAASHDNVGQAQHDQLGGVVDGLEAGPALAHDRVGGDLDGQTGFEGRDAGQVGRVGALLGLTEDDLVDSLGLYARAFESIDDDDLREIFWLYVLDATADPSAGCSGGTDDYDFVHYVTFLVIC